ncbi:MAG: GTP cyclohydrolase I FolE [Gammaproteobacteria bacterium]
MSVLAAAPGNAHSRGLSSELASPLAGADDDLRPEAIKVRNALKRRGLETPLVALSQSAVERREQIERYLAQIMTLLGLDLADDSLADTPKRVARMYIEEVFSGLDYRNFPKMTTVENKMRVDGMIRITDIHVCSTCEHHFVTIDGTGTVAYIPHEKVIGLSKINRVMAFFARRPQIQERLTEQVLVALQTLLETDDVAVSISAAHYCVKARGVKDPGSETTTTALGGRFKADPGTRLEFTTSLRGRSA